MALECPLRTSLPHSAFEATHAGVHPPEIRWEALHRRKDEEPGPATHGSVGCSLMSFARVIVDTPRHDSRR